MNNVVHVNKPIAVLGGTGREGRGLSYRLARAGYEINIGSRSLEKAQKTVKDLFTTFTEQVKVHAATYTEAVKCSEIIILSVPYIAHQEVLFGIKEFMKGKLLLDVTVPNIAMGIDKVDIPPAVSAAQEARKILGENTEVCSAFQSISYKTLLDSSASDGEILVTGTSEKARQVVIDIVTDIGFRGWDAGPLENSLVVEGLTKVLIYINHKYNSSRAGIKITGV